MRTFNITKKGEFKQTIAVLDSAELSRLIADAISEKLGIDINNEKNSFYYSNLMNFQHLISGELKDHAVGIHFIEKIDSHA